MIIYGKQVFYYILKNHKDIVNEIILSKKLDSKEFRNLQKLNIPIKITDNKKAQSLARGGNHQGYFLDINFTPKESKNIKELKSVLILDHITDMGNIGAIVRTAYSLGIDTIIVTGINELKWENVIRMSAGAAIDMPILVIKNILDVINDLKTNKFRIIGADMGGKTQIEKSEKMALIMGSEGEGLSKKVKSKLDEIVSIEMKRSFDSLNVSVATGILIDRIFNE
ncbi:MAG: 23S rRNA (guanosine(2251)-2'-O)-methyltransferase RlmB [Nautilia sp.]|nr:MAG: 23S rRNA (guanosine(2251)-2'-O)-methyltransferase RlmB [Nautilia sp.]